jgi:F-type H+-transporting ATPase subunit b
MTFNSWTFVFEVVNFLVLAYLLQRFLYRPLHDAVDRRRQTIEKERVEAESARQQAEVDREQLKAQLAAMDGERQAMQREARQEAEVERDHILTSAAQETERRATAAREALAREREETLGSLRQDVVGEATRLAERLLRQASGADLDARLAGRLADTVRSIPATERDVLKRNWTAGELATLQTAHELAPHAVDQVREAVAEVLGRDTPLQILPAPELVSGVRLRLDGHIWDASLAGQLEGFDDGDTRVEPG